MSLFGSSRRDDRLAATLLVTIVLAVHALAHACQLWQPRPVADLIDAMTQAHAALARRELPFWDPRGDGAPALLAAALFYPPNWLFGLGADRLWQLALAALHAALAGATTFFLLRTRQRSRYAAFLGGAAYALSTTVLGLWIAPGEQAAAAWAPWLLTLASRCGPAHTRHRAAAWLPLAASILVATGGGGVAAAAFAMLGAGLWRALRQRSRADRAAALPVVAKATAITAAITAPATLFWAQHLRHLTTTSTSVWSPVSLLTRAPEAQLVSADLVRLPGAFVLAAALLGLLRQQRHAAAWPWWAAAFGGILLPLLVPTLPEWPTLLVGALWMTTLAGVVLATAGLDDFLELPLRRPLAQSGAWLAVAGTSVGIAIADLPAHWPFVLGGCLWCILAPAWRPLGMTRFKTVLAVGVLVGLGGAALQSLAGASDAHGTVAGNLQLRALAPAGLPPAAPAGETAVAMPVAIGRDDPGHRRFEVTVSHAPFVFAQPTLLAPGWQGALDQEPLPATAIDPTGGGILVPIGRHTITQVYRPWSVWPGLGLAALGLLFALVRLPWRRSACA